MTRRLAAILAADVAGYSRLMHENEEATHGRFTDIMRDAVEPAMAEHTGRIVKSTGDGFLAEFGSTVEAVRCAMQIQDGVARITADDEAERRIELRVGIHIGEVIVEERDIYGDGVNIAARLEGLAEPGGIMISESVHENVRGRLPCEFEDLGEQQVKNIARPVHLFRVVSAALRTHPTRRPPATPERASVAVLPFQNLSGDPDQDNFVDGIVEDVTTALSRFHLLFVIARKSAFAYRGRELDMRQVGRELGARYVLEGSLRKVGTRLRISGQAVQTDTGAHLWAERYDRDLSDVFAVQDELTASIVSALLPAIERAEIARTRHKPADSLDAYDLYLRALAAHRVLARDANATGRVMIEQALALDPHFVPALVLADEIGAAAVANGWLPHDALDDCLRHARRAVQLAPEDADALAALAERAASVARDGAQAVQWAGRAVMANPHSASVWRKSGFACLRAGHAEQALQLLQRAQRLSAGPADAYRSACGTAYALIELGRDTEAAETAHQATQQSPGSPEAFRALAAAQALAGNRAETEAALARLRELDPRCSIEAIQHRCVVTEAGGTRVLEGLRRAGLPQAIVATTGTIGSTSTADGADTELTLRPAARRRPEPVHLLLVSRPGEPVRDVIIGSAPLLVGRAADADLVLNDNRVSRAHCRIMLTAQGVTATDLNSTNGTLVDGKLITRTTPLKPGAVLEIGSFRLEYQRDEPVDPDGTMVAVLPHGRSAMPGSDESA